MQRSKKFRSQPTYCRICEAACGLLLDLDDQGQPLRLRPDRQHPISRGFVCAKGTRFLETASHPDRLRYPMRRRPHGGYERISWIEAHQFLAQRLRPTLDQYGPHAVGLYFGNPLAFNALGALTMVGLMRALGSRNAFTAGSQDCNNKFAGSQLIHGSPLIHPIPDFAQTDLALMLGTNPAVSQSSFIHLEGGSRVFDELVARGGKLVWIDPRRTESARRWGDHLPIRPGTDVFLLLALLDALRDRHQPASTVTGLETLLEIAADYPLERAASLTGLDCGQLSALAEAIRTTPRTTFHMSVGVNQGSFGTLCYVVLQALAYLSGNFDRQGGLLFHPIGVLVAEVARRLHIGTDTVYSRVGHFPSVLDSLPGGILADEILTPGPEQIRALIVVAGDPLKSIPGVGKLQQALKQLDLLVSLDLFANQTGREADLLLPTTSWLERWDAATTTVFFQQTPFLQYAGPVQPPPGAARSEAHILADLSLALGRPLFGSHLLTKLWQALAWDVGLAKITDIIAWPLRPFFGGARGLPTLRPRPDRYLGRGPRTPGRQVRFWQPALAGEPVRLAQFAAELEQRQGVVLNSTVGEPIGQPFTLICRRRRLAHNSWLHGGLRDGQAEAVVWMAPADMARLNLLDKASILIRTTETSLILPVVSSDDVAPGMLIIPHGLPQANVNGLIPSTPEMIEPLSGQHRMTGVPVWVEPGSG